MRLVGRFLDRPRFDLPLLGKMLVPFVALTVVVGVLGVLFVTEDLEDRAEAALNADLQRRIVEARSFVHERELYVLESGNYAANLRGMAEAISERDGASVARLLQSVLVLKGDLSLAVAVGPDGVGIAELSPRPGRTARAEQGGLWRAHPFVREALRSSDGRRTAGVFHGSVPMVGVAAPICAGDRACEPVGVTIVAIRATSLINATGGEAGGRALFDADGAMIASEGAAPPSLGGVSEPIRRTFTANGERMAVAFAPFSLRGEPVGSIAIATPVAPAFAAAQNAARRLGLILVAAIVGVIVVASLLVRMIVRRLRVVVETNRRLGAGELSARAHVGTGDEIGELATGFNTMADQLQAAVETLELRVEQRTEEIRRLLTERTQFFASLSHEFRTPLAIILAQADRLEDRKHSSNGKRTKEITSSIRQSASQALEIVNDVLEVARAETDRVELRLEPIDIARALRDVKPTIEGLAAPANIAVEVDVPADLPKVPADRTRLREILLNLGDNAVKYTPRGGRIRLTASARRGQVRVEVADDGPGIPLETGERIFEPFYRVPGSEPQHGRQSSGLGLALTRRLVEAHGGVISYECPPEGGTVFSVILPVAVSATGSTRSANGPR